MGYLYLRKDVQETYLKYCDHLARSLLLIENAPIELKQSQILNAGEETNKFFRKMSQHNQNDSLLFHKTEIVSS